jgi:deoxyribose-phosphate aldolase
MTTKSLNEYFDHTILKPNATKAQIRALCEEAKLNHFATVCVNPY